MNFILLLAVEKELRVITTSSVLLASVCSVESGLLAFSWAHPIESSITLPVERDQP